MAKIVPPHSLVVSIHAAEFQGSVGEGVESLKIFEGASYAGRAQYLAVHRRAEQGY